MKGNQALASAMLTILMLTMASCATVNEIAHAPGDGYRATVVWTDYGIPHITADDYGSLGYGEGYAAARDHLCTISDAVVTARGEQALYFGPGDNDEYAIADIVVKALGVPDMARAKYAEEDAKTHEWMDGYAAGFNRYLREAQEDGISEWCEGAEFVRELTGEDVFVRLVSTAPTVPRMAAMVAAAQPPGTESAKRFDVTDEMLAHADAGMRMNGMGSNGWAFGKDRTANGRGMLLGNPHYPWYGTNRFWEKQLTIPGEMNIYGSGLVGTPGVAIGFNEYVGWTHTVSNSQRVVTYKLDLVPGDPTSYLYDGEPRKMVSKTVTVQVKTDAGIVDKTHTVWFSHHGPIVVNKQMPWNEKEAYAVRDANAYNFNAYHQWQDMAAATSMDEFIAAHDRWNAMPWINSIATSHDGQAAYIDGSNVGNLSPEALAIWQQSIDAVPALKAAYESSRTIILPGSSSVFEFQDDPDSRVPGVVPFKNKPQIVRSDFAFNSNDSYWISNPSAPMTGYSPLYGPTGTTRSPRTRVNALMLMDTSQGSHYGDDGRFTLDEMQATIFSNRSLTAELLRDELVHACAGVGWTTIGEERVNIGEARNIIAAYNGRLDLDSVGAVLFREWITGYSDAEIAKPGGLWKVPFDANDPVNTPNGLGDYDLAVQKLGEAVLILKKAGLPLDATLADTQFGYRYGTNIAVHGGNSHEGVANLIVSRNADVRGFELGATKIEGSASLTDKGYPVVHGSSFILCLNYTDDGPHAEALLTYCQSRNPNSPHCTDQTYLFADKQFRPIYFTKEDVDANAKEVAVLYGSR